MRQSTVNNREMLSPAAQQENSDRDGSVSPYLGNVASKMFAANRALDEVQQAASKLYIHSDPKQQKALETIERDLHGSRQSLDFARKELPNAQPEHNATLAKNGQSQFNAASRGDPRSMEPQIAQQNAPPKKPKVVTISASPQEARDTSVERNRGEAMKKFEQAHDAQQKTAAKPPQVNSEQVENTKPEPHHRPSPELGSGVDRGAHLHAKGKDDQASRQATEKHANNEPQAAAGKEIEPKLMKEYEAIAAEHQKGQSMANNSQSQNQGRSIRQSH